MKRIIPGTKVEINKIKAYRLKKKKYIQLTKKFGLDKHITLLYCIDRLFCLPVV